MSFKNCLVLSNFKIQVTAHPVSPTVRVIFNRAGIKFLQFFNRNKNNNKKWKRNVPVRHLQDHVGDKVDVVERAGRAVTRQVTTGLPIHVFITDIFSHSLTYKLDPNYMERSHM